MTTNDLNKNRLNESLMAAEIIVTILQREEITLLQLELAIHESQIITNKLLALKQSLVGVPEPMVGGLPEVKVKG